LRVVTHRESLMRLTESSFTGQLRA
jgi:hypothetical protein